jgi:hypothetical protein
MVSRGWRRYWHSLSVMLECREIIVKVGCKPFAHFPPAVHSWAIALAAEASKIFWRLFMAVEVPPEWLRDWHFAVTMPVRDPLSSAARRIGGRPWRSGAGDFPTPQPDRIIISPSGAAVEMRRARRLRSTARSIPAVARPGRHTLPRYGCPHQHSALPQSGALERRLFTNR